MCYSFRQIKRRTTFAGKVKREKEDTYRPRPGIGNPPFVLNPAVIQTLLVRVVPVENGSDVTHAVHANRRAFEYGAEKDEHMRHRPENADFRDPLGILLEDMQKGSETVPRLLLLQESSPRDQKGAGRGA